MDKLQYQLDLIQSWLSETAENIVDWDWYGEELIIFSYNNYVEKYCYSDLQQIIKGF